MFVRMMFVLVVLHLTASAAMPQTVIHVRQGAPAGGDGTTWASAYASLDSAIADALDRTQGTVSIWLAEGIYTPSVRRVPPDPRSATFYLRWSAASNSSRSLHLIGGFAGGEVDVSQRQPALRRSIISGDIAGDDAEVNLDGLPGGVLFPNPPNQINRTDNVYTLVQVAGLGPDDPTRVVLDGLWLTGGYYNPGTVDTSYFPGGTAIHQGSSSHVTARNCWIVDNGGPLSTIPVNEQQVPSQAWDMGFADLTAVIEACVFAGNYSGAYGGAMFARENVVVVNSIFTGNSALGDGGAIFSRGQQTCLSRDQNGLAVRWVTVTNCTFVGNRAGSRGPAYFSSCGSDTLNNCVIWGNEVSGAPGSPQVNTEPSPIPNTNITHDPPWVRFSIVGPPIVGIQTEGLVSGQPIFLDADGADNRPGTVDDNFRLSVGSPGIDAGRRNVDVNVSNNPVLRIYAPSELPPLDIVGNPRVFDGDADTLAEVDTGPYELIDCAQTFSDVLWVNSTGGMFSVSGNWRTLVPWAPPPPPGTGTRALFRLRSESVYAVTFGGDTLLDSIGVCNDRVALSLTGWRLTLLGDVSQPLSVGGELTPASLTVVGGTLATPGFSVGREEGPNTLPSDELIVPGIGSRLSASVRGVVGETGRGSLRVLAGGQATAAFLDVSAGSDSGAGEVIVSGSGGTQFPSRLSVTSSMTVGVTGRGELHVEDGAHATIQTLRVGSGSATGDVRVRGTGSRIDAPFFAIAERGTIDVGVDSVLSSAFGTFVLADGSLVGEGRVLGPVVNIGVVSPGAVSAGGGSAVGTLQIGQSGQGLYRQVGGSVLQGTGGAAGVLRINAVRPVSGQPPVYDLLRIDGSAELAGGLIVEYAAGVEPLDGESQPAFLTSMGTLTGSFDVALVPAIGGNRFLRPRVVSLLRGPGGPSAEVRLFIENLPGNINYIGNVQNAQINGGPVAAAIGNLYQLPGQTDEFPDLAIAVPGAVVVLPNRGNTPEGQWQGFDDSMASVIVIAGTGIDPSAIAVADLDGDGFDDIVVADRSSNSVRVLRQSAPGTFAALDPVPVGNEPVALAIAQFDRNHGQDIAVANFASGTVSILSQRQGPFGFERVSPDPIITNPGISSVASYNPDRDKNIDIVLSNTLDSTVSVFSNRTTMPGQAATFLQGPVLAVGAGPFQVVVAEMASQGARLDDIVTLNRGAPGVDGGSISVIIARPEQSMGGISFAPAVNLPISGQLLSMVAVDLDGDRAEDADLAILRRGEEPSTVPEVLVLRNDSNRSPQVVLAPALTLEAGSGALVLLAEDVNLSGQRDLVSVQRTGLRGPGGGTGRVRSIPNALPRPCPADFNSSGAVSVQDLYDFFTIWNAESIVNVGTVTADVNFDGVVTVQDIYDFITDWSLGCP